MEDLKVKARLGQVSLAESKIIYADKEFFEGGHYNPNVKVENGKLKVKVEGEWYDVRWEGDFGRLVNFVIGELENRNIVVVKGLRGIGKSTLGSAVVWKMLEGGKVNLVFAVKELQGSTLKSSFENIIEDYNIFSPLIVYDPSSPIFYGESRGSEVSQVISATVSNLLDIVKRKGGKLLIILPDDLYNESLGLKDYVLEVSLKDETFLSAVLREYSKKCTLTDNVVKVLVGEILNKFDAGYTLATRLAGQLISENCKVDDVAKIIEWSEGKIHKFIAWFINYFFNVVTDKGEPRPFRVNVLTKIFSIRSRFTKYFSSQFPLISHGIIRVIESQEANNQEEMNEDMVNWLVYRQHDLIEDTIEMILNRDERLGASLYYWRGVKVPQEIKDEERASKYSLNNYVKELVKRLKSDGVFKDEKNLSRLALILGLAIGFHYIVPDKNKVPDDIRSSLNYALEISKIDEYFLVDNKIPAFLPSLITFLYFTENLSSLISDIVQQHSSVLEWINNEVYRVMNVCEKRGIIIDLEGFYLFGIFLFVAKGVKISEDTAAKLLKGIYVHFSTRILPDIYDYISQPLILSLADLVPEHYLPILGLSLLTSSDNIDNIKGIYSILRDILQKYESRLKFKKWPLINIISIFIRLTQYYKSVFNENEINFMLENIEKCLKDLEGSFLHKIAMAEILNEALHNYVLRYVLRKLLGLNKTTEITNELVKVVNVFFEKVKKLEEGNDAGELFDDKTIEYFKNAMLKFNNENVRNFIHTFIFNIRLIDKILAEDGAKESNIDEIIRICEDLVKEYEYRVRSENKLVDVTDLISYFGVRRTFLKFMAIKDEFDNLVEGFRQLFKESMKYPALGLIISKILGNYLVCSALAGNINEVEDLLKKYLELLEINKIESVSTKLMLTLLLGDKLNDDTRGKLKVNGIEIMEAIDADVLDSIKPALKLALGVNSFKESIHECNSLEDDVKKVICLSYISLTKKLMYKYFKYFYKDFFMQFISNFSEDIPFWDILQELLDKLDGKLLDKLDGKSIIQLISPIVPFSRLILMLYALVNNNVDLGKAHAVFSYKLYQQHGLPLLASLFKEVYDKCCDLKNFEFKKALVKLYLFL